MPHEFKFVVDGEIDEATQAHIARAVADAGSRALLDSVKPAREALLLDVSRIRRWDWVGMVAWLDERAAQVADRVRELALR